MQAEVRAMKVYFYDRESGIYQGEGFEEDHSDLENDGVIDIAPPTYDKGFVPRFDRQAGRWILTPASPRKEPSAHRQPICRIVNPVE
jgi:hypothetical protein